MTQAKLESERQLVTTVAERIVIQQQAKEAVRQISQQRISAIDELDDWMRDFRTIARVALRQFPEFREQIRAAPRHKDDSTETLET